jgi:hypothetical protein
MSSFIFILYCVVGCEASHPSHRIITAYETLELCDRAKRDAETQGHDVYSCERTEFVKDLPAFKAKP